MSPEIKIALAVPDLKLREILIYLLKSWEYHVAVLEENDDVISHIKGDNPSLVIIDAALGNKKGLEVCKEIKKDFLTSYTPTIVLIDKKQLRRDLLSIEQGVDDYLIKPPDPIDLEIRIVLALRSAAHQFNANALTRLPGNRLIERRLTEKIHSRQNFSFHYVDIDNFKTYNDKYGHIKGDRVITHTAAILSKNIKKYGNEDDFLGHIGGDDFVVITSPDKTELIAKEVIADFDQISGDFYSEEDRGKGFIFTTDRSGRVGNIPLMSLSVAIANNISGNIPNLIALTDITTEIKKYLKTLPGSNFMIDRRSLNKGIESRISAKRREHLDI
ncbi:MAG: diguanylate cyclase [Candidatus Omnitrophota bacterium]